MFFLLSFKHSASVTMKSRQYKWRSIIQLENISSHPVTVAKKEFLLVLKLHNVNFDDSHLFIEGLLELSSRHSRYSKVSLHASFAFLKKRKGGGGHDLKNMQQKALIYVRNYVYETLIFSSIKRFVSTSVKFTFEEYLQSSHRTQ